MPAGARGPGGFSARANSFTGLATNYAAVTGISTATDGADTALTCTVSGAATTCTSAALIAAVAAGSRLSFELTPGGIGLPASSILIGWETG